MPERVRGLPLVDTFLAVFPKKVQIWHYLHDGGLERFKQMPSFDDYHRWNRLRTANPVTSSSVFYFLL